MNYGMYNGADSGPDPNAGIGSLGNNNNSKFMRPDQREDVSQNSSVNFNMNSSANYNNVNPQPVPNTPVNPGVTKEKKPKGAFARIMGSIGLAALFGIFAAGMFVLTMLIFDKTGLINTGGMFKNSNAASQAVVVQPTEKPDTSVQNIYTADQTVTAVVTDVTKVVEDKMPSIVSVINNYSYTYYYYEADGEASGSGIIVGSNDDELLIATNYHVIENNNDLKVVFCDDTTVEADVKGTDADMDLAVIAVKLDDIDESTLDSIEYATLGDSDALKVGEPVIAIGNALGYGQSVTSGVVSALNRTIGNVEGNTFIQTDAAINPGNSGGALLNLAGELIGINSNKIGGSTVEGMGYAIPINVAKPIIENLMQRETRREVDDDERGYLGLSGATISRSEAQFYGFPEGVYISSVTNGSPADDADLHKGDFIYSIDGEKVTTMDKLQELLSCYKAGETVTVRFYTQENNEYVCKEVNVTLASREDIG